MQQSGDFPTVDADRLTRPISCKCLKYLDDIFIFAGAADETSTNLADVLRRIQGASFTLNPKKSCSLPNSVDYQSKRIEPIKRNFRVSLDSLKTIGSLYRPLPNRHAHAQTA